MLGAAAVALTLAVSPAFAADDSGVKLGLGGHFKGYANYSDEGQGTRKTDLLRDTEVHFGGETTLDNGLTVGAHIEATADAADAFAIDESYVYMAGSWGRVNVGEEDGASYLLQVAAPSADDNIDGVRQSIIPTTLGTGVSVDYANDLARNGDKLTYLSPVFSGFQAGASYTPHLTVLGDGVDAAGAGPNRTDINTGVSELAVRYEGMFSNVGIIAGAGYEASTKNDREWNVGVDLDIGAFGLGAVYTKANAGDGPLFGTGPSLVFADETTWVLGADYTTGPFKIGASYLNADANDVGSLDRYAAGVIYSYGPGMTFRGSLGYADANADAASGLSDADATTVTVGTQINF